MKLNSRHKLGLKLARMLPPSLSWKFLKIPTVNILARDSGTVVQETKEDLSSLIPLQKGDVGEIIGCEVFAFKEGYSTHWGANLTSEGRLIVELSRQGQGMDKMHFSFGKPRIRRVRYIKGTVATLTIEHRSNYFHFLCDAIARLQLIQNLKCPPDYIYVQGNHKYQAEILARFGYQPHQIIDSSVYPFIQAEQLLVPSYVSNFSLLTVNSIAFLRSKLRKDPAQAAISSGKVVFISRKDTPRRKILNEDQVLDSLSQFQVESAVLSDLSLDQQIELFEGADAIVITTGAALANLVFARSDLHLILITPPNWFGDSALEIIKPFGLTFSHIVLSDYPQDTDPYAQNIHLTPKEIQTIAQELATLKK